MIRVVLIDDHDVVRRAIRDMLDMSGDVEVVGEATDGADAVALVERVKPDVVLMDVSMPQTNGIEATRLVKARFPGLPVIALSTSGEISSVAGMVKSGASGYLYKGGSREELVGALTAAVHGSADSPLVDELGLGQ